MDALVTLIFLGIVYELCININPAPHCHFWLRSTQHHTVLSLLKLIPRSGALASAWIPPSTYEII